MNNLDKKVEIIFKQLVYGLVEVEIQDIGEVYSFRQIDKKLTSSDGDIPLYKIGTLGGKADEYISKETYEKLKKSQKIPKKGDLIISIQGTIGKTFIHNGEDAYYQASMYGIEVDKCIILGEYLELQLERVTYKTVGSFIKKLPKEELEKIKIQVPTLDIQIKTINFLKEMKKDIVETELMLEKIDKEFEFFKEDMCSKLKERE